MRVCQLLFLGVLLILTTNEASAQDECPKGFPFVCFVHLWENETNAGKEFVHAFNTEAFFDAHCKDVEKCNTDCPTTLTKVDKSDIRNKGLVFKCNPKNLFCSEKKKVECIPIRKVYRLSEKGASSQPQLVPQEPIETTGTDLNEIKTTTQEPPPAPASSDGDSFVPDLVEIQTIVLPICRREDTEKDCMTLTSERFCTTTSSQYLAHEYLPWSDIKTICTIVESPLGGESPKWLAEYVKNKKENLEAMKIVWEYTGFPFDIVTNKSSPFLAHRHDYGTNNCKKYAENTENCLPLPICDDGKHFITYSIRMKNVLDSNDGYFVEQGKSECERACETWEEPTLDNQCRILDIEHLPLDRQNSPPYAKFATLADNLQRRKSGSTGRSEPPNLFEVTTEKAPLVRRDAVAHLTTPTRYYGRPIDLKTVNEEDYADIESNYWLSTKRNPFYKKYGDKIKLINASMCAYDSKETFCRSPPTTPNLNVDNTSHNSTMTAAKKRSSLPWWAIQLIMLFCLVIFLSIGAGIWLFCIKNKDKKTKDRTSTKPTQSMKERQIPLREKSTVLDVTQYWTDGHPEKSSPPKNQ